MPEFFVSCFMDSGDVLFETQPMAGHCDSAWILFHSSHFDLLGKNQPLEIGIF